MKNKDIKILVACEESQVVTKAFRGRGFSAFSCDILPASGGLGKYHYCEDVREVLAREKFDLVIAHPPCTYLTVTGNKWFLPEFRDRFPDRIKQREKAVEFFKFFATLGVPTAIENPVGIISTVWRKPDQYIHPYQFGDPHSKKTGLWLVNGLPPLVPTKTVEPEFKIYANGKKDPLWHYETLGLPAAERTRKRSETFPGIADAMATQWGDFIKSRYGK